jgi:cysteine/O-acetylserine efflux protein
MLDLNLTAFLSFVLITSFSPGPNNISTASVGVLHGYKRTLRYQMGISTGFFVVMLLCGWISNTLLEALPSFEAALRLFGAGYILWLAIETARADYTFDEGPQALLGFTRGLVLQVLNLKVIIYGLTIYATFLAPIADSPAYLVLSALFLAAVALCSTSSWALFGSAIRTYLRQPKIQKSVNLVLSLLLAYTAIELSGVLAAIR